MGFYKNVAGIYINRSTHLEDGKRYLVDTTGINRDSNIYAQDLVWKLHGGSLIIQAQQASGPNCSRCIFHTDGRMCDGHCIAPIFGVPSCKINNYDGYEFHRVDSL